MTRQQAARHEAIDTVARHPTTPSPPLSPAPPLPFHSSNLLPGPSPSTVPPTHDGRVWTNRRGRCGYLGRFGRFGSLGNNGARLEQGHGGPCGDAAERANGRSVHSPRAHRTVRRPRQHHLPLFIIHERRDALLAEPKPWLSGNMQGQRIGGSKPRSERVKESSQVRHSQTAPCGCY